MFRTCLRMAHAWTVRGCRDRPISIPWILAWMSSRVLCDIDIQWISVTLLYFVRRHVTLMISYMISYIISCTISIYFLIISYIYSTDSFILLCVHLLGVWLPRMRESESFMAMSWFWPSRPKAKNWALHLPQLSKLSAKLYAALNLSSCRCRSLEKWALKLSLKLCGESAECKGVQNRTSNGLRHADITRSWTLLWQTLRSSISLSTPLSLAFEFRHH